MEIIICDDEIIYIEKLRTILKQIFADKSIEFNIHIFTDSYNCFNYLNEHDADIVFLDIYLENKLGRDLAIKLRNNKRNFNLIFLTSSNDFAHESFVAKAKYYILKPITYDKILTALNHCPNFVHNTPDFVFNFNNTTYKLFTKNILYIEVLDKYIYIHMTKTTLKIYVSFREITNQLLSQDKEGKFLLLNRSFIINMEQIIYSGNDHFIMSDNKKVYSTTRNRKKVQNQYMMFLLEQMKKNII